MSLRRVLFVLFMSLSYAVILPERALPSAVSISRFSPWGLRFSQIKRGLRFSPSGLRFSPRGLRSSFFGSSF